MRTLILVITSLATLLLVIDEVFIGIPPPAWVHPLVYLLLTVTLLRPRPIARQRRAVIALAAVVLSLIVVHLVPWPTRHPFFADLFSIKPGMAPSEVRKIMAHHREGTGWPANTFDASQAAGEFTIRGAIVFRPASAGPGDSDWGIVHFEKGKVTKVEFSPD